MYVFSGSPTKKQKLQITEKKTETCSHGENCYRRNPHHFKEYDHPHCEYSM